MHLYEDGMRELDGLIVGLYAPSLRTWCSILEWTRVRYKAKHAYGV